MEICISVFLDIYIIKIAVKLPHPLFHNGIVNERLEDAIESVYLQDIEHQKDTESST